MSYTLAQTIQKDSFWVKDLDLCELRLQNDANLVWLILVPKRDNVIELIDLSEKDQFALLWEINQISHLLKVHFPCDKLNIASLGNVVPQLHIHVIARRFNDSYFPKPPFGFSPTPYTAEQKDALIQKLQRLLA